MRINVTQRDIDKGEPWDPWKCPVARAINRKMGPGTAVVSHPDITVAFADDTSFTIPTPQPINRFLTLFDERHPVAPFSIELEGL